MLQLINTHTAELCHPLTNSPNYLVLPRHPLNYSTFLFNYVAKLRLTTHSLSVTVTKMFQKTIFTNLQLTKIPLTNPFHGPHEDLPLPHGVGLTITNPSP